MINLALKIDIKSHWRRVCVSSADSTVRHLIIEEGLALVVAKLDTLLSGGGVFVDLGW